MAESRPDEVDCKIMGQILIERDSSVNTDWKLFVLYDFVKSVKKILHMFIAHWEISKLGVHPASTSPQKRIF